MSYTEIFAWGIGIPLFVYFLGWTMGHCFDLVGASDDLAWLDRDHE